MYKLALLFSLFLISCEQKKTCMDKCQDIYNDCMTVKQCTDGYCHRETKDTPECREVLTRCFDTCKTIQDSQQDKK